jgi:hypothetical protein
VQVCKMALSVSLGFSSNTSLSPPTTTGHPHHCEVVDCLKHTLEFAIRLSPAPPERGCANGGQIRTRAHASMSESPGRFQQLPDALCGVTRWLLLLPVGGPAPSRATAGSAA